MALPIPPELSADRFLNALIHSAEDGICIISPQGMTVFANDSFARMLGYEAQELVGRLVTGLMSPAGLRQFLARKAQREAGQLRDRYELEFLHKVNKDVVYVSVSATPVCDDEGKPLYSLGVFANITPLKLLQRKLLAHQERLEMAQEIARIGFGELDIKTKTLFLSREYLQIIGWTDPTSMPTWDEYVALTHPEDAERMSALRRKTAETGAPFHQEFRIIRPDGEIRTLLASVRAVKSTYGAPIKICATALDITDRVRTDELITEQREKLIANAKLTALGEMAGGIAHEVNTPLAVLKLSSDHLLESLRESASEGGALDLKSLTAVARSIDSTVDTIARVIQGLRTLSRDASGEPVREVKIAPIIENTLAICRKRLESERVELQIDPLPDAILTVNATEISQALLNLLQNSIEALKNSPEKKISLSFKISEESLTVRITDTGCGIPRALHEKIFQPFFTTKEIGKGPGIGLSTARTLIERHRGRLDLDPDHPGTSFVIRLPRNVQAPMEILNPDEAIDAHLNWRQQLTRYLVHVDGSLEAETAGREDLCPLGQWIRTLGTEYRDKPGFTALERDHRRFHEHAGELVQRANRGESVLAEAVLGSRSAYDLASTELVATLRELRKIATTRGDAASSFPSDASLRQRTGT